MIMIKKELFFDPIRRPLPLPIPPVVIKRSLTVTGKVYDLTTSGLGKNLKVCICDVTENTDGTKNVKVLASTMSLRDGSYYMTLGNTELADYTLQDLGMSLELFVYQGMLQLDLEKKEQVVVDSFNKSALKHIHVYSLPSVKGVLKRKNNVAAIKCRVELYKIGDTEPLGYDITGFNGQYEIPYKIESDNILERTRSRLYLKFYNNEDVVASSDEQNPVLKTISGSNVTYSGSKYPITEAATSKHDINDLIIKTDEDTGDKYYYIVNQVGSDAVPTLIYFKNYIKEDGDAYRHDSWRIVGNKKVLDKRVIYDGEGKNRKIYTKAESVSGEIKKSTITGKVLLRKSTNALIDSSTEQDFSTSVTKYVEEIESYRESKSPDLLPKKYIERINFRFTKDSIDLYTRLTTRKEEMLVELPDIIKSNDPILSNPNYLTREIR